MDSDDEFEESMVEPHIDPLPNLPKMDALTLASVLDTNSPTFSGKPEEDASSHFLNFQDQITDLQAIAPADAPIHQLPAQLNKFKKTLRGKPRIWMEGKAFTTIANLRTAFIAKYGKEPSRSEDMRQLTRAQIGPNETLNQYADRLSEAAARLDFQDDFVVDLFIAGLPVDHQLYVKGKGPRTMENALKFSKEYRDIQKSSGGASTSNINFNIKEDKTPALGDMMVELKALIIESNSRDNNPNGSRGILRKSPERSRHSPSRNVRFQQRPGWSPQRGRSPSPAPYSRDRGSNRGYSSYRGRSPSPGRDKFYQRGRSPQRYQRTPPSSRGSTPTRYGNTSANGKTCWSCGKQGHFYRNCVQPNHRSHNQIAEREAMRAFLHTEDQYFQKSHQ